MTVTVHQAGRPRAGGGREPRGLSLLDQVLGDDGCALRADGGIVESICSNEIAGPGGAFADTMTT